MKRALQTLGSTRLAIVLLGTLALVVITQAGGSRAAWWLALALGLLTLNLAAALLSHPRLRRGGLGVFHVALLALAILAAVGQLTRLQARIEITQGNALRDGALEEMQRGPLHRGRLGAIDFVQGPFTVQYAPGLKRGHTASLVYLPDGVRRVVGDDEPLVLSGYRFYTTHNKGFAPVITWIPHHESPVSGAIHMPSYPLFDWKQDQDWQVPGSPALRFSLQLKLPRDDDGSWTLDSETVQASLVFDYGGRRIELQPRESVRLAEGTLRFDDLRTWMGYKIFFDPTLPWMFAAALIGVLGLAWHLLGGALRMPSLAPPSETVPARMGAVP